MKHDLALLGTELCYCWESASSAVSGSDTPAVYRWVVREAGTERVLEILLGETPRFAGEADAADAAHLAERLREHRRAGHDVCLEVLSFTHLEVDGHRVCPAEGLHDRLVRRLLSHLFAFQHSREGHRVFDA